MPDLQYLLATTAALHDHLCPRQVLGVRTGLLAARLFGLDLPQIDKRLFAFVETDGCYSDGISVSTGCWLGHRTLRLVDYGKVACTLVDTQTGKTLRIIPHPAARATALLRARDAADPWHAQLEAYQTMPDGELLHVQPVRLSMSLQSIISRPGLRVQCAMCGEEIMNEREVLRDGQALCRRCAGIDSYYCAEAAPDLHGVHASRQEGRE
jgi:formylmethanofuran dehydrogenase subunit E